MTAKLSQWYSAAGIFTLNSVLLLVIINLLMGRHYAKQDAQPVIYQAHTLDQLLPAYPNWSRDEVNQLLTETWARPMQCTSEASLFREALYHGDYVNVDAAGYRLNGTDSAWPPRDEHFTVFVFGGSTTFGYGLPDPETIPAHLERFLREQTTSPVMVYNFGTGYYESRQEGNRFADLLRDGFIPDQAVFIDGLNDAAHGGYPPAHVCASRPLGTLPMIRWAGEQRAVQASNYPSEADSGYAQRALQQWWSSKAQIEAMAAVYGVEILFVWQPVPDYGYDLSAHTLELTRADLYRGEFVRRVYEVMAQDHAASDLCDTPWQNLLYLADLQRDKHENLYVDQRHYNARFAEEIARAIADRMEAPGSTVSCLSSTP